MTPGVILRSWRATWSANVPLPRYHLLHGSQQRRWKRSSSANDGPTTARSDLQIPTQPSHRRTGSSNPHRDRPPGPAQPYRDGEDLDFFLRRARRWRRGDIEDFAEPCRAEMDVDLIGPDLDPIDHGSKKGTLACCRQLGPALADLRGSREQPALR